MNVKYKNIKYRNIKFIKYRSQIDFNFYKSKKFKTIKNNKTYLKKKTINFLIQNNKIKDDQIKDNQIKDNIHKKITIKFCCFVGRRNNLEILHKYIEKALEEKIIDEYHMFDFTRNINDSNFIYVEYNRLNNIYKNNIFIYNHSENKEKILKNIKDNFKNDWSPFYSVISQKIFYSNSVIIKCDDDILFIELNGLKNAIKNRINDNYSFLIHSNCINNNICSYFHRESYPKIEKHLENYPKGGILGKIFEIPMLSYHLHSQFYTDLFNSLENIDKYKIDDVYVKSRISINFILINGNDCKYFENTKYNDEYELSSFYPEKFFRPNKIYGEFITSHYSYSLQEKFLDLKKDIRNSYKILSEKYLSNYNNLSAGKINLNNNLVKFKYEIKDKLIKVKNFLSVDDFYIRSNQLNKYLYIDYEDNILKLSNNKTLFQINNCNSDTIYIKKGIYYFMKYNLVSEFKNRNILINFLGDFNEKKIIKVYENNEMYLKFAKSSLFININNDKITLSNIKKNSWTFENHKYNNEYLYLKRFIKNKKFYYKNLENNEIFTNFYLGWGNENIIF